MILGFTGTQKGMTQRQRATVRYLFSELNMEVLHHGDCVGADAQAHREAEAYEIDIVVHPPTDGVKRAFCQPRVNVTVLDPRPYLARNRDIIAAGTDGLIAAPRGHVEQPRGSGTWATVRYARKARRRIWIVFPDGTFKEEPHALTGAEPTQIMFDEPKV